MTVQSVQINSITPAIATIINDVVIDGFTDGQPFRYVRTHNGQLKPAIGTTVQLPYGTGHVVGYTESNRLRIAITDFSEDFEFITADETDIYDAEEYVAMVSKTYNSGVASDRETFTRLHKSEVTGKLSQRNLDRMNASMFFLADNEVVTSLTDYPFASTDSVVVQTIGMERETPKERRARIKAERALAKRLANAMLEDLEMPEDVASEIDAEFADVDMDF